jgi:hypothetical protein
MVASRSIPLCTPSCAANHRKGVDSYPAASLEQVFGAIAFYLANRASIDDYLREGSAEFAQLRAEARRRNPALYAKLEAARQATQPPNA